MIADTSLRQLQSAQDDYERASAATRGALSEEHKARIRQLATDFPMLWSNPATPQRERKRMIRLLIEDVTLAKAGMIHVHVRFRGGQTTSLVLPPPLPAWKIRQTDPEAVALLGHLLDEHTDLEVAMALNAAGHHSGLGKPFTARIVLELRRSNHLPSHAERLRARGLLGLDEVAQRLSVSTATVKKWDQAGLLESIRANDKNERLYAPPRPDDPRLVKRMGSKLERRVLIESTTGGAV